MERSPRQQALTAPEDTILGDETSKLDFDSSEIESIVPEDNQGK